MSANSWIAHVKQYASSHNVSYKQAMKNAGASYNKKAVSYGPKRKYTRKAKN
jgi:hypothetical protein